MNSTKPCPECGSDIAYSARSCACGWGQRGSRYRADASSAQSVAERKQAIAGIEAVETERARHWLRERGVIRQGMTRQEHLQACSAFRKRLAVEPKLGPRDWADLIVSYHADGKRVDGYPLQLAREVLGMRDAEEREAA